MHLLVAHHFWGRPGGGELVMASIAVGAERAGYQPVLTSLSDFDKRRYVEWFGIDITRYPVVALPLRVKAFGLYMRLLVWLPVRKAMKRFGANLVVIDMPTYRPIEKKAKIFEYIHFPLELSFLGKFRHMGFHYKQDPYMAERYGKFPMNVYAGIYARLFEKFARENPFEAAERVFTNSKWTASLVEKAYGERPEVLNPPLPPSLHVEEEPPDFDRREPVVLMIGRYSQEKRYHWVVSKVAPLLFKEVDARLVIIGDASTPTSAGYYRQVENLVERLGLKDRVLLVRNAPRQHINEWIEKARVFLHATINEHWGIVVAEAMAGGLPVAVHKSGGAWTDLAEEGNNGLGYLEEGEAAGILADLLIDKKKWKYYSLKSLSRVKELTFDNFINKVKKYL